MTSSWRSARRDGKPGPGLLLTAGALEIIVCAVPPGGRRFCFLAPEGVRPMSQPQSIESPAVTETTSPLLPTFARADLAFERGEGAWLYTAAGDRYLDFG